jgi:hypothetical protein
VCTEMSRNNGENDEEFDTLCLFCIVLLLGLFKSGRMLVLRHVARIGMPRRFWFERGRLRAGFYGNVLDM